MRNFEYALVRGFDFHEFNGSIKLRKGTVDVCLGDPYSGLLLEYLLHHNQSFYDNLEYARELPKGCNSIEDAYYKGLLDCVINPVDIQEATIGILTPIKLRKAEKALSAIDFIKICGRKSADARAYHLNLRGIAHAYESFRVNL